MSEDEKRPAAELLEDGSILAPLKDDGGAKYTMVKLEPGEEEHAEWLALIQRERGHRPAETRTASEGADARPTGGGAFWDGQTFVGLGGLGLVIAAVLFFTESGPFEEAREPCIVTATAGKLCGDDARAWCDATDPARALDPTLTGEAQRLCDDIR